MRHPIPGFLVLVATLHPAVAGPVPDPTVPPAAKESRSALERAEREAQRLMNAGLPFAEKMLREHGEFFPFGGIMLPSGKIRTVGAFDDREQPPAEEVLAMLLDQLREGALTGDFKAAAVFVNVRVPQPRDGEPVSAIHVGLEHRDGYCVDVFFPFERVLGLLQMDEPFAGPRDGTVFPSCNESQAPE